MLAKAGNRSSTIDTCPPPPPCGTHGKPTKNTGDEPEHSNHTTPDFYVARVGYQTYCEYQKQLLTEIDGE